MASRMASSSMTALPRIAAKQRARSRLHSPFSGKPARSGRRDRLHPQTLPAYRLPSPFDRAPLRRRATSFALAVAINLSLLLLLIGLGGVKAPQQPRSSPLTVDLGPHTPRSSPERH